jgi:hypothetical protein
MGSGVLAVLFLFFNFLFFNEVYLTTGPTPFPLRHDLTAEAIRLNGNQIGLIRMMSFSFGRLDRPHRI